MFIHFISYNKYPALPSVQSGNPSVSGFYESPISNPRALSFQASALPRDHRGRHMTDRLIINSPISFHILNLYRLGVSVSTNPETAVSIRGRHFLNFKCGLGLERGSKQPREDNWVAT